MEVEIGFRGGDEENSEEIIWVESEVESALDELDEEGK